MSEKDNLLEFTNDLKGKERKEVLAILDKMNKINAKEKDVIKKCLEIFDSIEEFNNKKELRENLEKSFNSMVNKLEWFDIFKVNLYINKDEEVIKITEYIDTIENKETSDNVDILEKMINEYNGDKKIKGNLERKLNIAKKRVERSISANLGGLFLTTRKNSKVTLQELADITGYSPSYINRIEKGERKAPTVPILLSIARALDIDESVVLGVINKKKEDVQFLSLRDVLYSNEFSIEGNPISVEKKNLILELISFVFNSKDNFETDDEERQLVKLAQRLVKEEPKTKRVVKRNKS